MNCWGWLLKVLVRVTLVDVNDLLMANASPLLGRHGSKRAGNHNIIIARDWAQLRASRYRRRIVDVGNGM